MKKIYYIGYYDVHENKEKKRNVSLAGVTKMSYIATALEKNGYDVEIVSPATAKSGKIEKGQYMRLGERTHLKLFFSLGWGVMVKRVLCRFITKTLFSLYILGNIGKEDTVIAYHTLAFLKLLPIFKRIKGFKLVMEVEEIYGDVLDDAQTSEREKRYFKIADGYIFPNRILNDQINLHSKPCAIIHGTYNQEQEKGVSFEDETGRKIHIVYAGTFDPRKGVFAAIEAAKYLERDYHIHIIGFGTDEQVQAVSQAVEDTARCSRCTISYDGLFSGEEYIEFLQKCQVGLSTQNPQAKFNDTSFPSKILSYMSNGLRVVSVRIPAIETSDVGDAVYCYDEQTGENIAEAIKNIDFSDGYDGRALLAELDKKFVLDIDDLLNNL